MQKTGVELNEFQYYVLIYTQRNYDRLIERRASICRMESHPAWGTLYMSNGFLQL